MDRSGRARLLAAERGRLVDLAALLVGDPHLAPDLVDAASGGLLPRRDPERLLAAVRGRLLRQARRATSPWSRADPLARAGAGDREVLALRLSGLPLPGVAALLDVGVGEAVARERRGLAALDVDAVEDLAGPVREWLDASLLDVPRPAPVRRGGALRGAAGFVAVAVLAVVGAVAVDAAPAPAPPRPAVAEREEPSEPPGEDPGPTPTASVCGAPGALCAPVQERSTLPSSVGVRETAGTPFWPFTTDREAADWAVAPGERAWAADPVEVARRLATDLLGLAGTAADGLGGGSVALQRDGAPLGTVRLVRLGRGERRPWSVTGVTSPRVALADVETLGPDDEVQGSGATRVRLLATDGALLAAGPLGTALDVPDDWSVGALVLESSGGLALRPVRRDGAYDEGLPAPGSTFVGLVDGSVRLFDALSGAQVLQVSGPDGGTRDDDPSRGGRDGVLFVRTEPDGCASGVLRAALDRGAGGTAVRTAPLTRRLPRLSPSGAWLAWVEQPCGGGPAELVRRGADARLVRTPLGSRALTSLDLRDDGSAVLQLAGPDRVVDLPARATALPPAVGVRSGCSATGAAASGASLLLWERCGTTSTPLLVGPAGQRALGPPGQGVLQSAVVTAPDGELVLVRTDDGAVRRLVDGRLVEVLGPCLGAPGCLVSIDW